MGDPRPAAPHAAPDQRAAGIDPGRFRNVLGHFPTGVVVVTAVAPDGELAGMAVGSFTSVSLDPPLVAFLPTRSSRSFPKIRSAGSFCVNVLAGDQESVCRAFASPGADKFAGLSWHPAGSGAPVLDGVLAWIDCDIDQVLDAGDHHIVLGRVRDLSVGDENSPLVFFRGGYGEFSPASLSAPAEPDLLSHLRVLDIARREMESLAAELGLECLAITTVRRELVTVGAAGSPSGDPADRIGQRMPFVPPLGALFVAWSGPAAVREWLDRLDPHLPKGDAMRYEQLVETIRRRGWSMALADRPQVAFERAVAELSAREPTPAQLAAVREAAAAVGPGSHGPADLAPGRPYRVRNLSTPVFNAAGTVVLVLTLTGLPRVLEAEEIERHRDRLLTGTRRITQALGGRLPGA